MGLVDLLLPPSLFGMLLPVSKECINWLISGNSIKQSGKSLFFFNMDLGLWSEIRSF